MGLGVSAFVFLGMDRDREPETPPEILKAPPAATRLGRIELKGEAGLLKLHAFDALYEVVWASPHPIDEVRAWYVGRFLRSYRLEREGPSGETLVTLVGSESGSQGEIVVGVTLSSRGPRVRDLRESSLEPPPATTRTFVTVRVVDQ